MDALLGKVFDFSIRIFELVNYLDEEEIQFPMKYSLTKCAESLCVFLRVTTHLPKSAREYQVEAFRLALEVECLLEIMVKTSILNEAQSIPILTDCRNIISELENRLL